MATSRNVILTIPQLLKDLEAYGEKGDTVCIVLCVMRAHSCEG